ncbi:MAG: hypothetical protein ACK5LP_02830 [Campylobacteraceae bacterium]
MENRTILKAIYFKEWIKLKRLVIVPFLVLIAFIIDAYMKYKGVISIHGSSALWLDLIYKQSIHFAKLEWALIGGGVWFACLQFIPECSNKRLRLLFHLPVSYKFSMYSMLSLGVMLNLLLLLIASFGLFIVFNTLHFPYELYIPMIKTIFPWSLAGIVAYFVTATVIAEPMILRKLGFVFVGAIYISLLTATNGFNSISSHLWIYILVSLPWILTFESAALRVKEGKI